MHALAPWWLAKVAYSTTMTTSSLALAASPIVCASDCCRGFARILDVISQLDLIGPDPYPQPRGVALQRAAGPILPV